VPIVPIVPIAIDQSEPGLQHMEVNLSKPVPETVWVPLAAAMNQLDRATEQAAWEQIKKAVGRNDLKMRYFSKGTVRAFDPTWIEFLADYGPDDGVNRTQLSFLDGQGKSAVLFFRIRDSKEARRFDVPSVVQEIEVEAAGLKRLRADENRKPGRPSKGTDACMALFRERVRQNEVAASQAAEARTLRELLEREVPSESLPSVQTIKTKIRSEYLIHQNKMRPPL